MTSEALKVALAHYKNQIGLAEDRIQFYKDSIVANGQAIPDATSEGIHNARSLIEAYQTGVRVIEQRLARDGRVNNDTPAP